MNATTWPGHRPAALSLIVPEGNIEPRFWLEALRAFDLHATFFVSPTDVLRDVVNWRNLINDGNAVGNGCLNGVTDDGVLPNWTSKMIEQELHMAQTFLEDMFVSHDVDCFMAPGRNLSCADGNYASILEQSYRYIITRWGGVNGCSQNLQALRSCRVDQALTTPNADGWTILRLHSLDELDEVGTWIMDHPRDRWCATVAEVARFVRTAE